MSFDKIDKSAVIDVLNEILELELAGVVRYTHYSFMIFGHHRIPIQGWLKSRGAESLDHAYQAGELVTTLGGHPSLKVGKLLETHQHDLNEMLQEVLDHEKAGIAAYEKLLALVDGKNVMLEEYARDMIRMEDVDVAEVEKMLRKPGDLEPMR